MPRPCCFRRSKLLLMLLMPWVTVHVLPNNLSWDAPGVYFIKSSWTSNWFFLSNFYSIMLQIWHVITANIVSDPNGSQLLIIDILLRYDSFSHVVTKSQVLTHKPSVKSVFGGISPCVPWQGPEIVLNVNIEVSFAKTNNAASCCGFKHMNLCYM